MPKAVVTGSGGLIGSECVRQLVEAGFDVIGIENDMRARFFGDAASTRWISEQLSDAYRSEFRWVDLDIRDTDGIMRVFEQNRDGLELVIHAAAQPSHDWAARDPQTDFTVNANGTSNLLEATRAHA